jgi:hypothetical protein
MSLRSLAVLLCALLIAARAHAQTDPAPPKAPDVPPPPLPATAGDPDLEPQVTITRRGADTHEEVRVNGELRYIKVTPRIGPPYYLVPGGPGQQFIRRDSFDLGLRPPMWQLFSW